MGWMGEEGSLWWSTDSAPKTIFAATLPLHVPSGGFVPLSEYHDYDPFESLGTAHFIGGVKNWSVEQSVDGQVIISHSVTVDSW